MKYYSELMAVEEQIYRVDALASLFRVIANGANESTTEDLTDTLYYVEGSLSDITDQMREKFDRLFQNVRSEEFKTGPVYNFEPLQAVVNNWVKQ